MRFNKREKREREGEVNTKSLSVCIAPASGNLKKQFVESPNASCEDTFDKPIVRA